MGDEGVSKTYVIAEAGSCHDGEFQTAVGLVSAARDAGADAVKFQFWSDPDALADRRRVPQGYRDIYRRYRVHETWLADLAHHARARGIDFMCTAYLPQDVALLAPLVRHFKVASFENQAWDLLRAHEPFLAEDKAAGRDRWLIVSQGMGYDWNACGLMGDSGLLDQLRLLHCTSAYPAPVESLRLACIRDHEYGMDVDGFSDHSDPALTWTGALAVAAGATIVEAHLRLDDTDPENPDAPHAMNPGQFDCYVRHVRFAEACLGAVKGYAIHPVEEPMARYKVRGQ